MLTTFPIRNRYTAKRLRVTWSWEAGVLRGGGGKAAVTRQTIKKKNSRRVKLKKQRRVSYYPGGKNLTEKTILEQKKSVIQTTLLRKPCRGLVFRMKNYIIFRFSCAEFSVSYHNKKIVLTKQKKENFFFFL